MEDKPATPDNDSSIEDTNSRDELIADKFVELEELNADEVVDQLKPKVDIADEYLAKLLEQVDPEIKLSWRPVPTPAVQRRSKYSCGCFGACFGRAIMKDAKGVHKIGAELQPDHVKELKNYIILCQTPFNHNDATHQQLVVQLYTSMNPTDTDGIQPDTTNKKPMVSKKWEQIGFLGTDPQTEFRGVGIFGAYMIYYLATTQPTLTQQLLTLSNDPNKKFPLAVALLHFVNIVMQTAKEGHLNEFINTKKSVLVVLQTVYVSIAEHFYRIWNLGQYTESKFHTVVHTRIEDKMATQWYSFVQSHSLAGKSTSRRRKNKQVNKID